MALSVRATLRLYCSTDGTVCTCHIVVILQHLWHCLYVPYCGYIAALMALSVRATLRALMALFVRAILPLYYSIDDTVCTCHIAALMTLPVHATLQH